MFSFLRANGSIVDSPSRRHGKGSEKDDPAPKGRHTSPSIPKVTFVKANLRSFVQWLA